MSEFELKTPQYDGRFPFVNQTKHCWQNYVDYQRCKNKKGEDFPACKEFFKVSRSLCPDDWVSAFFNVVLNTIMRMITYFINSILITPGIVSLGPRKFGRSNYYDLERLPSLIGA
ncbi:Cytochrome c oxidase subunit 6B [Zancudomyces culisetae]|uniref:Cytochrome c oxidase subunit 6B n=1 Tax=Zancudomyces culisetae TaxID=1213189 RepID=A0A1R1PDK6_ZANCU|nr:Cytochrome c oxidase subunit 6B [Zancudomyces culisetae]|eukprot:OMH79031.1 Cytochrome c oxidase subunit 6B [Zancudomyces culisetae]